MGSPSGRVDLTRPASRQSGPPTSGRHPDLAPLSGQGALLAVGALHHARNLDARRDLELLEQVPEVRLDGLRAQEQLRGDLRVGLAVDDEPRDLELALRELLCAGAVELSALRPAVPRFNTLGGADVGGRVQAGRLAPCPSTGSAR